MQLLTVSVRFFGGGHPRQIAHYPTDNLYRLITTAAISPGKFASD